MWIGAVTEPDTCLYKDRACQYYNMGLEKGKGKKILENGSFGVLHLQYTGFRIVLHMQNTDYSRGLHMQNTDYSRGLHMLNTEYSLGLHMLNQLYPISVDRKTSRLTSIVWINLDFPFLCY